MRNDERRLAVGEVVCAGDIFVYGEHSRIIVRSCKYDPGCCVGHVVEDNEIYYRRLTVTELQNLGLEGNG